MTLSFDPDALELPFYHFIGGERVQAGGGLEMRRPSDGKAYGDCPVADAAMVDRAVATAKEAQKASGWADARPRERLNAMHRWADLMQEEAVTLARLEAVSSTRPIAQLIDGDIAVTAEQIRFFAEFADKEGSDVVPTGTGEAWIRKYCADALPIHAAKTALFAAFNRRAGDLREELAHLGQIWADCMLRLSPSAISKLQRIAQTQDRMLARVYQRQTETA